MKDSAEGGWAVGLMQEESQRACICYTSKLSYVYFQMISYFLYVSCAVSDLCLSKLLTKQNKIQGLLSLTGGFFKKFIVGDGEMAQ